MKRRFVARFQQLQNELKASFVMDECNKKPYEIFFFYFM